ncbi:MAG: beta-hydroxyacyl-ACP dehydratase [Phycisphaeraceae bacterium]|nr:beta-hydroxyacyl-ACP dehydratase [Phycisphaeraceae bacterium]
MHFDLVDAVLEQDAERIVTVKQVSMAEEYLQDHFPSFPVLPGVLMIESLVQAARRLLIGRDPSCSRHVLGSVRALKYGGFVRPGDTLRVEVTLAKAEEGGVFAFKGQGLVVGPGTADLSNAPTAVSGRFTLRPLLVRTPALA